MDIVRFKGGLGNQMFQYAFYLALKNRNRTVKANLGFYRKYPEKRTFCLTDIFPNVILEYASDKEFDVIDMAWKKVKEDEVRLSNFLTDYGNRFFWAEDSEFRFRPEVFKTGNCAFVGFWQSEKYFFDVKDMVRQAFKFPYGEKKLDDWRKKMSESNQYVAVHVRRGDYLKSAELYGNLWEGRYYEAAILYVKERVPNAHFVFFSDDMQWVERNYHLKDAVYIKSSMFDHYQFWYDMCLMSCCSHNIIANSTFSWWGAWLNGNSSKMVIVPARWFFDGRADDDICPDSWIRIGEENLSCC